MLGAEVHAVVGTAEIAVDAVGKTHLKFVLHIHDVVVVVVVVDIFEILVQAVDLAVVAHADIERAAGSVEKSADFLHDFGHLALLVGLHMASGGIDHRGLEFYDVALFRYRGLRVGRFEPEGGKDVAAQVAALA